MINNEDNGLFNNSFLDMISVIGFAISIYNLMLNEQQLSNDDVAREVQINRNKLDEQNDKLAEYKRLYGELKPATTQNIENS